MTVGERRGKGSFRGSSLKRFNFWKISKFGFSSVLGLERKGGRDARREGGRKPASIGFKISYFLTLVMTIGRH